MLQKPSAELVLQTYTQEELAELYREKVVQDAQSQIEAFKQKLFDLNRLFQGEGFSETAGAAAPKKRGRKPKSAGSSQEIGVEKKRRGRPAKSASISLSGTAEENGEESERQPLGSLILSVLKKKPMKIQEIMEKIHEKGWNTKSSNPRMLISQELTKQLKKGSIEKAERGSYRKA